MEGMELGFLVVGAMEGVGLLWFLLVGTIAGWAAGKIMDKEGRGILKNMIIGCCGAYLGGWLLPILGITGAALATLGSILTINFLKFIFLKVKFNIQPYGFKHLLTLLVAAICIGINSLIPEQPQLLWDIILRSAIITLVYVGLNYFLKISEEMNNAINKTFEKLRIR